jgi:hypothetical protein
VLSSPDVAEWQLWDNCRNDDDRAYLRQLAASDPRCKIKELPGSDGTNASIGRFFKFCDDVDAFYVRLDDDVVYLQEDFFPKFASRALAARGDAVWFAPVIINNAICSWLLKLRAALRFEGPVTPYASCKFAWRRPELALALHPVFIEAVRANRLADFKIADEAVRLCRFSINAIGFFGADKVKLGERFCPAGEDEEEWLSIVFPIEAGKSGMIFGDLLAAHFSFYTQERFILQTDILRQYYQLAGIEPPPYQNPPIRLKDKLRALRSSFLGDKLEYDIALA